MSTTTTRHHPADGLIGMIDADGWINRRTDPEAEQAIEALNSQPSDCGACGLTFPTLTEIFSHPCDRRLVTDARPVAADEDTDERDDVDYQPHPGTGNGRSATTGKPASAAQEELIARLMKEVLGSTDADIVLALEGLTGGRNGTASALIDSLFTAKRAAVSAETPAPAPAANCKPNRFAGNCHRCGGHIPAEAGFLCRIDNRWAVEHNGPCPTTAPAPAPAERTGSTRPRTDVPAGRYAIESTGDNDLVFYRVDRPTEGPYAGRVYVKMIVGGHDDRNVAWRNVPGILDRIAEAGVVEAMLRYGHEIGRCGHCGRTLTDEASREAGIGPVCAAKLGW